MLSLVPRNPSFTAHNDLLCSNDKVDDTSPAYNDDHVSCDIEDTKDEGTNDADTKDENNCINEKNVE